MRKGFTLAEVLITLTVIGVVSALTIPQLVKNMNDYAYGKSKDTFDAKITEAMNQMKTNNEMDGYATNEKFVDVFVKYMKTSKRCDAATLTNCFPAQIYASDGTLVDTAAKLKTGVDFGKATYTSPLTAVQFSNGTSALISYDPTCVAADAFNNQATATGCLSMVYDVNGFSKPNQAGKDIRLFNVPQLGTSCAFTVGATCYGAPFTPTPMSLADCNAQKATLGITACSIDGDYWAGAVKACAGVNKLPSSAQALALAQDLYPGGTWTTWNSRPRVDGFWDATKASAWGISSGTRLWTSEERNDNLSFLRYFTSGFSYEGDAMRSGSNVKAVCLVGN